MGSARQVVPVIFDHAREIGRRTREGRLYRRQVILDLPHAPRWGDELELSIERINPKGHGVGSVEALVGPGAKAPRRFTVAVRRAVPGDRVRAAVETRRRGEIEARLAELLAPSPDRAVPACRHFGQREVPGQGCGGCTLQTLDYPAQLRAKEALVRRALAGVGLERDAVAPALGAEAPFRYRGKMELTFGVDHAGALALGLFPGGWHREVLALAECHLMSEVGAALIPVARRWAAELELPVYRSREGTGFLRGLTIREASRTDERMIELVTSPEDPVPTRGGPRAAAELAAELVDLLTSAAEGLGGRVTAAYWSVHHSQAGTPNRLEERHIAGAPVYHDVLALPGGRALRFAIHPRAFFQPNPRQAEVLCAQVIERLGAARAVLDLYCGAGTLGLCVAPYVEEVVGVEIVAESIANARANAAANGVTNVTWHVGDAGEVLRAQADAPWRSRLDAVVLDPPRAGLMPKALRELLELAPPRIVYVSCNPLALARDLAALSEAGYSLEGQVQPVDLFPQTAHVECIATLVRG